MAGYVRQSTADIIPTATVRAAPINAEYNAIRDAFAASGGHKHDGTAGEGEYIPLIADLDALNKIQVDTVNHLFGVFVDVSGTSVEQLRFQDGVIVPVTDNDIDLGTSALEFKNLYLDGTAKIDTLTVDENATIAGTLGVTSNTTLGGTLGVTGATTLSSTLGVTGNTTLGGTLGVTGATTLSSTLAVTGSATLSSTLSVSSNATVGGTLAVTGTTSSTGDFSVNTDKFTVAATTGNTAVAGTLAVTGNSTLSGTLGVTGATTLSSTAAISGNTTIGGTLGVTGTTTYSTLTGSNLTATGTINFSGATVSNLGTVTTAAIGGGTINNTVIGGSTPAAITGTTVTATSFVGPVTGNVTGNLSGNVTGNVTGDVTGDLTGNVTAATGTSTFNNVTVNGNLNMDATSAATITNLTAPTNDLDAATKKYVDDEISDLIGGAPGTLDTLNEIAAAINDDDNVYTTLTNSIATKLPKAGGTMSGAINMGGQKITNAGDPTAAQDLATKNYIDTTYVDYSSAGDAATDARKLATNAEDVQFTLADGSTTGYSALHYAAKAAASYDSFDDRYLGSKASDPTLDNDGNALITGALYFDSTNGVMKVYNGTEWANASSSIEGIKSNFYYTATSGQTAFSGSDDNSNTLVIDKAGLVNVYMNGVRLHEDDYTVSAASDSVTLAAGAATGDLIYLEVFGNFAGQSGADVAITGGSIVGLTELGIGEASPDRALHISASVPAIKLEDTDVAGLYHEIVPTAAGQLQFKVDAGNVQANSKFVTVIDGAERLKVDTSGIDVTGTAIMDALRVQTAQGNISIVNSASSLDFARAGTNYIRATNSAGNFNIITGADDFASSSLKLSPSSAVVNDNSADMDFRVESDSNTHMLFVDGGNNGVGIGVSSVSSDILTVGGSAYFKGTGSAIRFDKHGNAGSDNALYYANNSATNALYLGRDSGEVHIRTGGSTRLKVAGGTTTFNSKVAIRDDSLELHNADQDNVGLVFNYNGYQGSNTRFRDFSIFNGKHQIITKITGASDLLTHYGHAVFNEGSEDRDFRVESDSNTHAIFVDAGFDGVGIFKANPRTAFDVEGAISANAYTVISKFQSNNDVISFNYNINTSNGDITPKYSGSASSGGSFIHMTAGGSGTLDFRAAKHGTDSAAFNYTGAGKYMSMVPAGKNSGTMVFNEDSRTDIDFRVESDAYAHMFFVDSGANQVRLGTSASTQAFSVTAPQLEVTTGGSGGGGVGIKSDSSTSSTKAALSIWTRANGSGSTAYALGFYDGPTGTAEGSITVTSSGTTYNTTSDRRLKTDIQPIANGTEKLMAMNPVTHKWKADPHTGETVHGFIAQEMQEIVPEAVSGDPDGEEMMSMDYGRITPVLVAALQDAHKKIEALEERLAELEAK